MNAAVGSSFDRPRDLKRGRASEAEVDGSLGLRADGWPRGTYPRSAERAASSSEPALRGQSASYVTGADTTSTSSSATPARGIFAESGLALHSRANASPTTSAYEDLIAHDRPDFPSRPAGNSRGRGNMSVALATAADPERLAIATDALVRGFYANSNRLKVAAKRAAVQGLAAEVARVRPLPEELYPLTLATVRGTAASLKAAGFASGGAYLDELRLGHVEAGFAVHDALAREFRQCKLSVSRGLGPPNKAAELLDSKVDFDLDVDDGEPGDVAQSRRVDRCHGLLT